MSTTKKKIRPEQRPPLLAAFAVTTAAVALLWHFVSRRKCKCKNDSNNKAAIDKATVDKSTVNVGSVLPCFSATGPYFGKVYLDYNATSPIFPEVTEAMQPFLSCHWGNPSSVHCFSSHCREGLDLARQRVARMLGEDVVKEEIVFCSCGSEADNHAIVTAVHAALQQWKKKSSSSGNVDVDVDADDKPHIITFAIEHPAIVNCLKHLHNKGEIDEPTILPVNSDGVVDLDALRQALRPTTALVTIMHSNNEIGSLQPIREIVDIVRQYEQEGKAKGRVFVHTDAAQSCGKVIRVLQT